MWIWLSTKDCTFCSIGNFKCWSLSLLAFASTWDWGVYLYIESLLVKESLFLLKLIPFPRLVQCIWLILSRKFSSSPAGRKLRAWRQASRAGGGVFTEVNWLKTLCCATHLRDLRGLACNAALISSSFASIRIRRVCFLTLSLTEPVSLNLLTNLNIVFFEINGLLGCLRLNFLLVVAHDFLFFMYVLYM